MTDSYFGYESSRNQQLRALKDGARRMGEDVTRYPREPSTYVEPTINWDKPLTGDRKERSNALFSNDSIEYIRKRILAQNPEAVDQLADRWRRIGQVLDDLRVRVYKPASDLKNGGKTGEGWTGDGADAFLARGPGATLKSIDDWREAATANQNGAVKLAIEIRKYHQEINKLWGEYESKMLTYANEYKEAHFPEGKNTNLDTLPRDAKDSYVGFLKAHEIEFSKRAQKIQYRMAQGYWSVLSGEMGQGTATRYEGPTNAVQEKAPQFAPPRIGGMSGPGAPNVSPPQIGTPNVNMPPAMTIGPPPNLTAPPVTVPNGLGPPVLSPNPPPRLTPPTINPPNVSVVPPGAPALPPGLVRGVPATGVPPAIRTPPGLNGPSNLMNNLPGQKGVPGVLRPGSGPSLQSPGSAPSLPPQLPQGRRPPGAQIKAPGNPSNASLPPGMPGRGAPGQQAASPPPGARGGRPGAEALPGAARMAGTSGLPNQFGGPPNAPATPVLRSPRTEQPPQLPGMPGQGRGAPPGPARGNRPGVPNAASPVLGRPSGSAPVERPPATRAAPSSGNPELTPPPAPTSRPVLGRTPPLPTGGISPAESSGVLHGRRTGVPAYEGQIGSRKRTEDDRILTDEQEFDKIRQLLRQEDAWTVATPGGGVLDSAPVRSVTSATEPKPTVGG